MRRALAAGGLAIAMVFAGVSAAEASTSLPKASLSVSTPKASLSVSISYGADLQKSFAGTGQFHGTVTAVPRSTVVQVQRRTTAGIWRRIASVRTATRGAFSGKFTPSGLGRTSFRAHVPATKSRAAINSRLRVLTVSEMFPLDKIPLAHPADGVSFAPVTAPGGQVLPHTIVMDDAAVKSGDVTATWRVGDHCSKTFALVETAASEPGFVAEAVVGSGKDDFSASTVTDHGFALIQTPVTGARTLSLTTAAQDVGTGGEKVDWIFASVLCSANPRSL